MAGKISPSCKWNGMFPFRSVATKKVEQLRRLSVCSGKFRLETRVPFAFHPVEPEILAKWKAPQFLPVHAKKKLKESEKQFNVQSWISIQISLPYSYVVCIVVMGYSQNFEKYRPVLSSGRPPKNLPWYSLWRWYKAYNPWANGVYWNCFIWNQG